MNSMPEKPQIFSSQYGSYLTLGLQLALSVVVFFFLGRWLDSRFGTDPWLMLAGLVLGVAGGLTSFLKKAIAMGKEEDREAKLQKKEGE
jgi:ATP synthase protein I